MRVSTRLLASLAVSAGGASAAPEAADKWTVLPINGGGYVQHVQIAPSNPKVWYTYVDVGGPFTPGLVVASTADAEDICVSRDGGRHWTCLDGGMDVPTGTQHKLVLDRRRLFVLTRGSGVWVRTLEARGR